MKIGKLTISGWDGWKWGDRGIYNPLVILWKMAFIIPIAILIGMLYVLILVSQGKYTADEFIREWL